MRQCLFCDQNAATKEHIWPLWLTRRFDTPHGVAVDAERSGVALPGWRQQRHEIAARFVCGKCNNGWMSSLEGRAKPTIERLLDQDSSEIDAAAQATLITWATKSAMVFEVLRAKAPYFYAREACAALRETGSPPNRTVVWLAKCVDLTGLYVNASDHGESSALALTEARLVATTLAFGQVALQVVTLRLPSPPPPGARIDLDVRPGPWEDLTLQLGRPESPVTFPPRTGRGRIGGS